jgi:hypothetical protein
LALRSPTLTPTIAPPPHTHTPHSSLPLYTHSPPPPYNFQGLADFYGEGDSEVSGGVGNGTGDGAAGVVDAGGAVQDGATVADEGGGGAVGGAGVDVVPSSAVKIEPKES